MAGVIGHLGAVLPRNIFPPAADNERGFFESGPISCFNDDLLWSMGSSWGDWRRFDSRRLDASLRAGAERLLREEFGDARLFVLKDPRLCRLMPFWLSIFKNAGVAPRIVTAFRHPLEVARSLEARDGYSFEKGLLLWLRHILDAERETRRLPRVFVAMDELLDDWRTCVARIARDIGVDWPSIDRKTASKINKFLSRGLKHHNLDEGTRGAAPAWAERAFEALLELKENPRSRRACAALDRISESLDKASALFGPLVASGEASVARGRAIEEERRGLQVTLAERQSAIAALGEKLAECEGAAGALQRGLDERDSVIAALQRRLDERDSAIAALRGSLSEQDDALALHQRRLARAHGFIVRASERYAAKGNGASKGGFLGFGKHGSAVTPPACAPPRIYRALRESIFFDEEFYLDAYPDVKASGADAALHYLLCGGFEGRDPGPYFSSAGYLDQNPDVAAVGWNPLAHYELHGRAEGRALVEPEVCAKESAEAPPAKSPAGRE